MVALPLKSACVSFSFRSFRERMPVSSRSKSLIAFPPHGFPSRQLACLPLSLGGGLSLPRGGARGLRLLRKEIEKVGLPRLERRLCRLRLGGASLGRSRLRGGGRCLALRHQPFLPPIAPVTPPRPAPRRRAVLRACRRDFHHGALPRWRPTASGTAASGRRGRSRHSRPPPR